MTPIRGDARPITFPTLVEREGKAERTQGGSFAGQLGELLKTTEKLQLEADEQVAKTAMGGGNLHETALALEKADVSMRVLVKARNKLVEAYQEVMRMSV